MTGEAPWAALRRFTDARIGLGRAGAALPTREVLAFAMAHAQARDAVRTPIDWTPIAANLREEGLVPFEVESAALDRETYLRRPDLGRALSAESRNFLATLPLSRYDLLIVIGDGLSSTGVAANAAPLVKALLPYVAEHRWSIGPVFLAGQARVALGDDLGAAAGARAVLMLIGERPGLSSPDSLGAYLTLDPRPGRKDGERNCVSNIRAGGLTAAEAAFKLQWLLREAFRIGATGVALKDESDAALSHNAPSAPLAGPDRA